MTTQFRWVYVAEVKLPEKDKDGEDQWAVIGTHDKPEDAVKQADDSTEKRPTRVRQFKECYVPTVVPSTPYDLPDSSLVPTIPWFCPSHPDQVANALQTSEPRCPTCKQTMFQGAPTTIKDL